MSSQAAHNELKVEPDVKFLPRRQSMVCMASRYLVSGCLAFRSGRSSRLLATKSGPTEREQRETPRM